MQQIDLPRLVAYVVFMVTAVGIHEFAHAWVATKLGDPTPKAQDRLTLNPLNHADPVGTFVMPIAAYVMSFPLLGWGRPVPTQPYRYTRSVSMRTGLALVAAAGPLANLALGLATVVLSALAARVGVLSSVAASLCFDFIALNIVLFVFNLLPIHPLDGGKILSALLPAKFRKIDAFTERYGGMLILGLVLVGGQFLAVMVRPFMGAAQSLWKVLIA